MQRNSQHSGARRCICGSSARATSWKKHHDEHAAYSLTPALVLLSSTHVQLVGGQGSTHACNCTSLDTMLHFAHLKRTHSMFEQHLDGSTAFVKVRFPLPFTEMEAGF